MKTTLTVFVLLIFIAPATSLSGMLMASNTGENSVMMYNTVTMTNSPLAVREILNVASYRVFADLSKYTQYRLTLNVQTVGVAAADVHLEGSTDNTNFADLDAAGTEIAIAASGFKTTGWLNLQATYRVDGVYIRMMEKDGDGVADPVIRQATITFR